MAFKILIRRKFREAAMKDVMAMLIKARNNAMEHKGYISTETLISDEDPNTFLLLSMWQTKADWEKYRDSEARRENERRFAEILDGETEYEVFRMGMQS